MTRPARVEAASAGTEPVLQVVDMWKSFGHVAAVRGVSLSVRPGEVLALLGDNGAGKSTLVKLLAGVHAPDSGQILVRGSTLRAGNPRRAQQAGIATVFQDLALVETLDIAANMFLGQPLRRAYVFADRRRMISEAAATLQRLRVRLPNVRVPVGELSGGQRQGVAIARAVHQNTSIIVMDEPTAALGVRETAQVGEIVDSLRGQGRAVVVVSHDLEFVFRHADRAVVLRLGQVQGTRRLDQASRDEIVGLIMGMRQGGQPESEKGA